MAHFTARQYVFPSPPHGEAQQERKPELAVCVDESKKISKQEAGAGFGCPREELSPSTVATRACGSLGCPIPVTWGVLGMAWAGDTSTDRCLRDPWSLQVPPHGLAGCAH